MNDDDGDDDDDEISTLEDLSRAQKMIHIRGYMAAKNYSYESGRR